MMTKSRLSSSVDEVVKEIESLQKEIQKVGKKTFQEGDYVRTKLLIETSTRMDHLKMRLNETGSDLMDLYDEVAGHLKTIPAGKTRRTTKRIPRGMKTPENDYKVPILKALMDLDGKGKTSDVLDKVHARMKNTLNEFDKQPVPSVPSQQRWRHTAQIVRNKMVKEGHIKKDSPRGEWEITAAGKKIVGPKSTPKKSAPKKSAPKKSTPKKSTPKKSAPKKSTPKKSAPKKSTPKKDTKKTETKKTDTKKK